MIGGRPVGERREFRRVRAGAAVRRQAVAPARVLARLTAAVAGGTLGTMTMHGFLQGGAVVGLALTLAAGPAWAQDDEGPEARKAPRADSVERLLEEQQRDGAETRAARLEVLFERLAEAPSKERADKIAGNIRRLMLRSGSPTIDLLMVQANAAMREKNLSSALDVLDAVTRLAPEYPEGWNMRATVHFMRKDYGRSVADIERVLALEPRHWGALTGLAMILVSLDEDRAALTAMDEALAVHPHLDDLSERREKLAAELEGTDT